MIVLVLNFTNFGSYAPILGGAPIGGEITEILAPDGNTNGPSLFGYQTLIASAEILPDGDLESSGFLETSLQMNGEDALLPNQTPVTNIVPLTPSAPIVPRLPSYALGPDLGGYFIFPTTGFNRGRLHYYNAVDISAGESCVYNDIPVWAAASGIVTSANWATGVNKYDNGGYGNNILVLHPNGVVTRYAHLKQILVQNGQYINQGQVIAYVGGYPGTYGAGNSTGCHLHFEVRGARNPFVR